jgi:menaquinol-cytochrome c reductase iron-sulfur subunit
MKNTDTGRRGFLGFITSLLVAVLALLMAIPAIAYFLTPLWGRREAEGVEPGFGDVGPIAGLPVGEWRLLTLETDRLDGWKKTRTKHAVWVRRTGTGERDFTVLSAICPHLGCPIDWHSQESQFVCPCHKGTFDAGGTHIAGPPPRSMDTLDFEARAGRLLVRWQDFKIGVAERVSVNA